MNDMRKTPRLRTVLLLLVATLLASSVARAADPAIPVDGKGLPMWEIADSSKAAVRGALTGAKILT